MTYRLNLLTPSLYSNEGLTNCTDKLADEFATYVKYRAESEFGLQCQYNPVPGLAVIDNFENFERIFLSHSEYLVIIASPASQIPLRQFILRLLVFLTTKQIWQNRFLFVFLGRVEVLSTLVPNEPIRFSLNDWTDGDDECWIRLFDLLKATWEPYVEEQIPLHITTSTSTSPNSSQNDDLDGHNKAAHIYQEISEYPKLRKKVEVKQFVTRSVQGNLGKIDNYYFIGDRDCVKHVEYQDAITSLNYKEENYFTYEINSEENLNDFHSSEGSSISSSDDESEGIFICQSERDELAEQVIDEDDFEDNHGVLTKNIFSFENSHKKPKINEDEIENNNSKSDEIDIVNISDNDNKISKPKRTSYAQFNGRRNNDDNHEIKNVNSDKTVNKHHKNEVLDSGPLINIDIRDVPVDDFKEISYQNYRLDERSNKNKDIEQNSENLHTYGRFSLPMNRNNNNTHLNDFGVKSSRHLYIVDEEEHAHEYVSESNERTGETLHSEADGNISKIYDENAKSNEEEHEFESKNVNIHNESNLTYPDYEDSIDASIKVGNNILVSLNNNPTDTKIIANTEFIPSNLENIPDEDTLEDHWLHNDSSEYTLNINSLNSGVDKSPNLNNSDDKDTELASVGNLASKHREAFVQDIEDIDITHIEDQKKDENINTTMKYPDKSVIINASINIANNILVSSNNNPGETKLIENTELTPPSLENLPDEYSLEHHVKKLPTDEINSGKDQNIIDNNENITLEFFIKEYEVEAETDISLVTNVFSDKYPNISNKYTTNINSSNTNNESNNESNNEEIMNSDDQNTKSASFGNLDSERKDTVVEDIGGFIVDIGGSKNDENIYTTMNYPDKSDIIDGSMNFANNILVSSNNNPGETKLIENTELIPTNLENIPDKLSLEHHVNIERLATDEINSIPFGPHRIANNENILPEILIKNYEVEADTDRSLVTNIFRDQFHNDPSQYTTNINSLNSGVDKSPNLNNDDIEMRISEDKDVKFASIDSKPRDTIIQNIEDFIKRAEDPKNDENINTTMKSPNKFDIRDVSIKVGNNILVSYNNNPGETKLIENTELTPSNLENISDELSLGHHVYNEKLPTDEINSGPFGPHTGEYPNRIANNENILPEILIKNYEVEAETDKSLVTNIFRDQFRNDPSEYTTNINSLNSSIDKSPNLIIDDIEIMNSEDKDAKLPSVGNLASKHRDTVVQDIDGFVKAVEDPNNDENNNTTIKFPDKSDIIDPHINVGDNILVSYSNESSEKKVFELTPPSLEYIPDELSVGHHVNNEKLTTDEINSGHHGEKDLDIMPSNENITSNLYHSSMKGYEVKAESGRSFVANEIRDQFHKVPRDVNCGTDIWPSSNTNEQEFINLNDKNENFATISNSDSTKLIDNVENPEKEVSINSTMGSDGKSDAQISDSIGDLKSDIYDSRKINYDAKGRNEIFLKEVGVNINSDGNSPLNQVIEPHSNTFLLDNKETKERTLNENDNLIKLETINPNPENNLFSNDVRFQEIILSDQYREEDNHPQLGFNENNERKSNELTLDNIDKYDNKLTYDNKDRSSNDIFKETYENLQQGDKDKFVNPDLTNVKLALKCDYVGNLSSKDDNNQQISINEQLNPIVLDSNDTYNKNIETKNKNSLGENNFNKDNSIVMENSKSIISSPILLWQKSNDRISDGGIRKLENRSFGESEFEEKQVEIDDLLQNEKSEMIDSESIFKNKKDDPLAEIGRTIKSELSVSSEIEYRIENHESKNFNETGEEGADEITELDTVSQFNRNDSTSLIYLNPTDSNDDIVSIRTNQDNSYLRSSLSFLRNIYSFPRYLWRIVIPPPVQLVGENRKNLSVTTRYLHSPWLVLLMFVAGTVASPYWVGFTRRVYQSTVGPIIIMETISSAVVHEEMINRKFAISSFKI